MTEPEKKGGFLLGSSERITIVRAVAARPPKTGFFSQDIAQETGIDDRIVPQHLQDLLLIGLVVCPKEPGVRDITRPTTYERVDSEDWSMVIEFLGQLGLSED